MQCVTPRFAPVQTRQSQCECSGPTRPWRTQTLAWAAIGRVASRIRADRQLLVAGRGAVRPPGMVCARSAWQTALSAGINHESLGGAGGEAIETLHEPVIAAFPQDDDSDG